jgi:aminoglycoside phosphotransferase (APT) family kinase protein
MNDHPVDPAHAARLIRTQFPELDPVRVQHLGEGCDSVAFDVNGDWVFRFPKRADVEAQLLVEMTFLPALAAQSPPIAVPEFRFRGRPSQEFPHQFGGYRRLPGTPGNRRGSPIQFGTIAPMLAHFLSWLHRFPAGDALALGVADQRLERVLEEAQREALEDFRIVEEIAPDAPLDAWRRCVQTTPPPASSASDFCLVHNDLAAEHVLVDDAGSRITGVIDWSDVAVGDRAIDFGGVVHWGGPAFLKDVLSHYDGPVSDGLIARAHFFAACRGVLDVEFGLERKRPEFVEGGLRALRMATRVSDLRPPPARL